MQRATILAVLILATFGSAQIPIEVGRYPRTLVLDTDYHQLYVLCEGANAVYVIDPWANEVTDVIPVGNQPSAACWSPELHRLFVGCGAPGGNHGMLYVINTDRITVEDSVDVGQYPTDLAYCDERAKVYAVSSEDTTVCIVSAAACTVIAIVPAGCQPLLLQHAPGVGLMYVAGNSRNHNGHLSAFDCSGDTLVSSARCGMWVAAVAYDSMRHRLYVTTQDRLWAVDASTNTLINCMVTGEQPRALLWTPPPLDRVWVGCGTGHVVNWAEADSFRQSGTVELEPDQNPINMCYNPATADVYVANELSGDLSQIDGMNPAVEYTHTVGPGPNAMACYLPRSRMFVACSWNNVVCSFDWAGVEEPEDEPQGAPSPHLTILRAPELARIGCRVMDIMGRDVTEGKARLSPGVYFLRRDTDDSEVHKVVLTR